MTVETSITTDQTDASRTLTAIVNAHIVPISAEPFDGTIVLEHGRIAALGTEVEVPEGATVVDAEGGWVLPGFVDAHVHPVQGGLERIRCDLSPLDSRAAYLDAVGSYAAAHPELPWILGGGWSMAAFPGGTPLAADLDAVVADRPVFLPNRDHHGAWVSSAALRIASSLPGTG